MCRSAYYGTRGEVQDAFRLSGAKLTTYDHGPRSVLKTRTGDHGTTIAVALIPGRKTQHQNEEGFVLPQT